MKRSKRYKFVKLSVFFLIYSIIHVVSVKSDDKQDSILKEALDKAESVQTEQKNNKENIKDLELTVKETIKDGKNIETTEIKEDAVNTKTNEEVKVDLKTEVVKPEKDTTKSPGKTEDNSTKKPPDTKEKDTKTTADNKEKQNEAPKDKEPKTHPKDTEKHNKPSNKDKDEVKHDKGNKNEHDKSLKEKAKPETKDTVNKEDLGQNAKTNKTDIGQNKNNTEANWYEKCTPPAIKQFPKPLMPPEVRKHGGLIIHTVVAIYMFIALAIICDEYFVASLDRICEELKMSPDVAGATFMAAGSSAPELATVIIGVFCADDDIGISGVIGSAVFNIMFVISVCALASSTVVYLNWWPLIRDSTFYAISILVMLIVIGDKEIQLWESIFMLAVYVVYGVALHFNHQLEALAHRIIPFKVPQPPNEQSGLISYKTLTDDGNKKPTYQAENEYGSGYQQQQPLEQIPEWNPGSDWSPEGNPPPIGFQNQQPQQPLSGPALNEATAEAPPQPFQPVAPVSTDYYRPKEFDPTTKIDPLVRPEGASNYSWTWIKWVTLYPIHFFAIYTMPDCRTEKYKNWYAFTFFMSMMWISFYSYFMVWMITIIGFTLSIPDTVMGLTFVAAGVSVPDALSSIAVIKEGYGDMAVSNAVGSNVFDILVCLGLPWFIKAATGSPVKVVSKGLWYSTFSLLSTVVFLVMAIHYNGWKLDKKFGVILMIWYLIFLTFASLYELNVFGNWNPPECKVPDW